MNTSKEIGIPFTDQQMYNRQMTKTLNDKMFFTNILPEDDYVFVDFGCADGAMIKELKKIYPGSRFIGYDCSQSMIDAARLNVGQDIDTIFTTDFHKVEQVLGFEHDTKRVLILSSVIHEVYSYAESEKDIEFFWEVLTSDWFDYICVRDMMYDKSMIRPSDPDAVKRLRGNLNIAKQVEDFERVAGPITDNKNLVHFLLKYRYLVNWNREVNENYFPVDIETFLKKFRKEDIIYLERFRVPFLDECIAEDFGISLTDYTHVKLIVKGFRK